VAVLKIIKTIIFVVLVLIPSQVFAQLPSLFQGFTTHGDLDTVFHAFHRIALICSDSRYHGLFISVIILSILITAWMTFSQGLYGTIDIKDMLRWLCTFIFGIILYRAFIVPTTTVGLYDNSSNQAIVVPDVPDAIVFLVNGMNMIESELVDIIATSGTPSGFNENPGGTGFNILIKMFEQNIDLSQTPDGGKGVQIDIQNYIKDCVAKEMVRPGTTLVVEDIMVNTDFNALLAQAVSNFESTSKSDGTVLSCTAAYTDINAYFSLVNDSHPALVKWQEEVCSKAGWYDKLVGASGPSRIQTCKNLATNFLANDVIRESLTDSQLFKQILVAKELQKFTLSSDADGAIKQQGDYSQGTSMIASSLMSTEWMPQIKSMMFASFLGMCPFLMIFMATAKWKSVLAFMFGCLIFFTTWGVCDAMLHQFAMDKALAIMKEVENGKLGLAGVLMMQSASMKAYAVFGNYRVWSMSLAVLFAGALTKVGADQIGKMSIKQGNEIQGSASEAGKQAMDPVTKARAMEGLTSAIPSQTMANMDMGMDRGSRSILQDKQAHLYAAEANNRQWGNDAANVRGENNHFSEMQRSAANYGATAAATITDQDKQGMLDQNAKVDALTKNAGTNAMMQEGGNTDDGINNLANALASTEMGAKASNMEAIKQAGALTGMTDRQVQGATAFYNTLSNTTKANAMHDATGGGKSQAKAMEGIENVNAAQNIAKAQEVAAIAHEHFGTGLKGLAKMSAVLAKASASSDTAQAMTDQKIADNYFGGNQVHAKKAMDMYKDTQNASEVYNLGKNAQGVADDKGKNAAATSQAISDYIKTVGQGGARAVAAEEKFNSASRMLWNEKLASDISGVPMSKGAQQALDGIRHNPSALKQFNAVGSGGGASATIQAGDEARAEGMAHMEKGSIEAGTPVTAKGTMDKNGKVAYTNMEGARGHKFADNAIRNFNFDNGSNHANIIQAIQDKNVGSQADRLLAAAKKGPAALEAEETKQAWTIAKELSNINTNSGTTTAGGTNSKGLSVSFGATAGRVVSDSRQNQSSINFNATKAKEAISSAFSESGGDRSKLVESYNKHVGSFVSGVSKKTAIANPEHYNDKFVENIVSPETKQAFSEMGKDLNARIGRRQALDEEIEEKK
jgi:hypothetical protein